MSQNPTPIKARQLHEEKVNLPYLPNAHGNHRVSPPNNYSRVSRTTGSLIRTVQVNLDAAGNNILDDAANEPNIAVNPLNPNQIVIGWRQFDNIASDFRQAGWGYSSNAGQAWTFPNRIDSGIFRSDPVLDFDATGNFYYNSLTVPGYFCRVYKSTNGGASWDAGTPAAGGDKQWMAIDRTGLSSEGNIYTAWSSYANSCDPDIFTRSTTAGASYENCTLIEDDPHFGTMTIDRTGNVYVSGYNFDSVFTVVAISSNAQVTGSNVNWDVKHVEMGGYIGGSFMNPVGLLGQINIEVDKSGGVNDGNIYLLATLSDYNNIDPSNVMFVRSTDGGLTWSIPMIINDDNSTFNTQWMGTLGVSPDGRIDAVWLDNRDGGGSDSSALYYSYSLDGGLTWSVNERMSELFDPHVGYPIQEKMGDYFDMISENDGAHLAWANTLNGEQDVYYSYITPGSTVSIKDNNEVSNVSIYPNPSSGSFYIKGNVNSKKLKVEIYSTLGNKIKEVSTELNEFNISEVPSGVYFVRIQLESGTTLIKRVIKQ